jgi:hypothetical protein
LCASNVCKAQLAQCSCVIRLADVLHRHD